jgi:hypothetical protein
LQDKLWIVLVVMLVAWLASVVLDVGGSSVHALLAVVVIVLCSSLVARQRSGQRREKSGDAAAVENLMLFVLSVRAVALNPLTPTARSAGRLKLIRDPTAAPAR